jgi:hypothetical protein
LRSDSVAGEPSSRRNTRTHMVALPWYKLGSIGPEVR